MNIGFFLMLLIGGFGLLLFPGPVLANRIIVFGIDETGSFTMRERGLSLAVSMIRDLDGGDVLYARRITGRSYNDDCSLFRLKVPPIPPAPANKFDRRAHLEWERQVKRARAVQAEAISILSNLSPVRAPKTDIWGFLAAAADRFKIEDGTDMRMIILASDMHDNVGCRIPLDLLGSVVVVVAFESKENAASTQKLKSYWTQTLKSCKAQKVIFLPPDSQFSLRRPAKEGK
ncbi:MAG: hypothetical protein FJ115_00040 [Deltaproteobacteria bacterium]|nr:hypothetical protein [Deltaproteobacteria bacterium]MBM4321918.1 hypothetical protein [Deltaproteobacteria bacterium]